MSVRHFIFAYPSGSMSKKICIGILGGGQLAKMSTLAASRLGFDISIMDKEMRSPSGQLTHRDTSVRVSGHLPRHTFASH